MLEVALVPLTPGDREQFITDNQEAFNYGALEEATTVYTDELAEQFAKEAGGLAPRPNEQNDETNERGVFVRQPNSFITKFGEKEGEFKAEKEK